MKTKQYIISLLDLYNNRRQCGLFYLQTNMPPVNIGKMFGTPIKLKKLLSDRWELHFQVMSSCVLSDVENSFSHSVVGTIKKIRRGSILDVSLGGRYRTPTIQVIKCEKGKFGCIHGFETSKSAHPGEKWLFTNPELRDPSRKVKLRR